MFKSLNNLHHAYLLVGEVSEVEAKLHTFFEAHDAKLVGSPDFFPFKEELFGIEEARELNLQAVRKAFGARKVFLIAPERLTLEAQNALLKTFEEPIPATHFFLVMREERLVLPTLLSRMQVVRVAASADASAEAARFLAMPTTKRLAFAKKFADAEQSLSAFLDELLFLLRSQGNKREAVRQVYEARLVSDDRGAAPRLILEHLSLVL
jgi:DNA polymerase III delta prime subunit